MVNDSDASTESSSQDSPLLGRTTRGGYKAINFGSEELEDDSSPRRPKWLGVAAAIVSSLLASAIVVIGTALNWKHDPKRGPNPTLLHVVDGKTSAKYVHCMENPVYEDLHKRIPSEALHSLILSDNDIHLWLDKDEMSQPHESLTVSWSEIPKADMESTVLTLYCGSVDQSGLLSSSLNAEDFIEAATIYQALSTSKRNIKMRGEGPSLQQSQNSWYIPRFPVTTHDACQFVMYRINDSHEYDKVAASQVLDLTIVAATPTNVHLAFGDDPTRMMLQFRTGASGTPVATFGESGKVSGSSVTYEASDMCSAPANVTKAGFFQPPGQLHTIELTDLEPNTRYAYKVGLASGQGIVWSQEQYSFTSNLAVGDDGNDGGNQTGFSFMFYGDQSISEAAEWTSALVAKQMPNIRSVHHAGDLSYAMGAAHVWDKWFDMLQSTFSPYVPLMVGVGNHEYDHSKGGDHGKDPSGVTTPSGYMPLWGNFHDDSGGECALPVARRFRMPKSNRSGTRTSLGIDELSDDLSPPSNGVFWYSYDSGTLHTIMISGEHDLSVGSPQRKWLEADLKAVNRSVTPWLIVEIHRPLYEAEPAWDQNTVGIAMRIKIERLLYEYQVDLVLAGHYHAYFRTCDGLYRSKCRSGSDYNGPMHITVGSAGYGLDRFRLVYPNHWTAKHIHQQFGISRVTVVNSTSLHFEFLRVGPPEDPKTGEVLDDVWIRRNR